MTNAERAGSPRTNEVWRKNGGGLWPMGSPTIAMLEHARQLEAELAAAKERLAQDKVFHAESERQLRECQDRAAAAESALAEARSLLLGAANEIRWWVSEHGCCAGHEKPIVTAIDAAISAEGK